MHFLLTTFGSSGDVFPLLGLGLELKRRGHRATLATNEHFESVVREHGIDFESLGTKSEYEQCIENPDLWKPNKAFAHVFRSLSTVVRRQYDLIESLNRREPIVTVSNCLALGARLAHEKLHVPNVTVHLQPSVIWSNIEPPELPNVFGPRWLKSFLFRLGCRFVVHPIALPFLNSWRSELGLPPIAHLMDWWQSPLLTIGMFPEWFAPSQADWPSSIVLTDFPLWNEGSGRPFDDSLSRFLAAGPPPIAFAAGTGNVHGHQFFSAAVEGCRIARLRAILLTRHAEQIPKNLPESVLHCPWVPLDDLLPRCAAFVHHGGIGSMSQAIAAGVPQLIMPLAHDQFDNAARVKRLGCGESLVPARFRPRKVANALRRILTAEEKTAAAHKLMANIKRGTGIELAANAIESRLIQ